MENEKKCKCISEIQAKVLDNAQIKYSDDSSVSNINAELDCVGFSILGNKMSVVTYSQVTVSYQKNGKTKKGKIDINHSFCPFCGEKKS